MPYEISIQQVAEQPIAALRERIAVAELGQRLRPLFDQLYDAVRRGAVAPRGHNLAVYRDAVRGAFDVEVGVQVAAGFAGAGEVIASSTPAGRAAHTVHWGPYSGLPAAHDAVLAWCKQHGHARAAVRWEVYGDWRADEAQLRTDVYYLLQQA